MGMRRVLAGVAALALAVGLPAGAIKAAERTGIAKYRFLEGSYWYVPKATLPAPSMDVATGAVTMLSDQTVWEITEYRLGYFWGRTVAQFTDPTTGVTEPPSCLRMIGSVTPDGEVQITFIPFGQSSALAAIRGTGKLGTRDDGAWRFQMQMSSGVTDLVVHWSYMDQCSPGDACERRLPGTQLGLRAFLAQCPAS